jgi:hypothetical protein
MLYTLLFDKKREKAMQTLKLEIEDSKLDIVLNIINNLKDDIIKRYVIINESQEDKDFINISQHHLEKIWDNQEDNIYDKYLKV